MRLTEPRIAPQGEAEWDEEIRSYINPQKRAEKDVHNIFKTLARHPKLAKSWMVFGNHILNKSSLQAREREILILRIGWLRQAGYEFGQHRRIGRQVGLTEREIDAIAEGPGSAGWSEDDRLLLRAVDELFTNNALTDPTWAELTRRLDIRQMLDLHFTVGAYAMVSMALNTLGVQLDDGLKGLPTVDSPPPGPPGQTAVRSAEPRIQPLPASEWDEETRYYINPGSEDESRVFNVFKTLAHHPKLTKRWMVFANYILRKSTLPGREREMAIVRVACLCRSDYEFAHHSRIGLEAGLSEAEIAAIADGPDHPRWRGADAALLRAVDELYLDSFIGDETWSSLCDRFDSKALMDLVFTVGNYTLLSIAVNSFGVALEEGFRGLPR